MNIFISVDMEGITGVTCWDDVSRTGASYGRFCQDVIAATQGLGAMLALA
jgi:D-aminopeptidase